MFCFSPALLKVRITMCRYWLQIDPPRVGDGHSIICGKASLSSHCRECHKHKNISRCTGSASKIDSNEYITTISLRALASLLRWDCVLCTILTTNSNYLFKSKIPNYYHLGMRSYEKLAKTCSNLLHIYTSNNGFK